VLPLLTQVIYWYDLSILLDLWEEGLAGGAPPSASMAACATLKYSMRLSVRLMQLLQIASSAGTLVHDRAEQVQSLLERFGEAAVHLSNRTFSLFQGLCTPSIVSQPRSARMVELCVEILLYGNTYAEVEDEQLEYVMKCLEDLVEAAGEAEPDAVKRKRGWSMQSSLLSSVYVVIPDLALKMPAGLIRGFVRLLVKYAALRDEMDERLCILEALRRLLMRLIHALVPASSFSMEGNPWPWDTPSLSPSQHGVPQSPTPLVMWRRLKTHVVSPPGSPTRTVLKSPVHNATSPEMIPPSTPSWLTISVNVPTVERNFPIIRQAIIAKIDALVNIGFSPKLTHSRQGKLAAGDDRDQLTGGTEGDLRSTGKEVMQGLLPMVEHKGLEMGVLRCVMELLCAACILVGEDNLGDCLPLVTESMIRRLGGEGVLSKVEKEFETVATADYIMLANDTGDTSLEGKAVDEDEEEEDVAMSSMEEDDWDDWDDEADIFNEDALVTEFGRFLEGLCTNFPQLSAEQLPSGPVLAENRQGSKLVTSMAPPPLSCRRGATAWPGVTEESARVLNWLADKHLNTR